MSSTAFASSVEIQRHLNCHPAIARLLFNRGFRSKEALDLFFQTDLASLPDPFSILDMDKAVLRVIDAIANEETIAVYGDYDVDGTCGLSLLYDFFKALGIEVIAYQPNRFTQGYGVHAEALLELVERGATLILTVDCGITAVDPIQVAQEAGTDVIVIDHHKVGEKLPSAMAVIDPQRAEDESGLKTVCGTGLAFFFVMALRSRLRAEGFFENRQDSNAEPNLVRLLDLVAIATVADVVDVRGVNRIFITHGLRVMAKNPRPGIRALLDVANIKAPTSMHCGFMLGPRINAAGRLESAQAALDLLTSDDYETAKRLAVKLDEINLERRKTQDEIVAQARSAALLQIERIQNDPVWNDLKKQNQIAEIGPWPRALVLCSYDLDENLQPWHEGVVGIVASKIVEEFSRPVFILSVKHSNSESQAAEILKGSIRSIPKIDILAQISQDRVRKHLLNFGGHAHAGGVTLLRSELEAFRLSLNEYMLQSTQVTDYVRENRFDAELELSEIDPRLLGELKKLEPFGHGFPDPIFKIVAKSAQNVRVLKEKHLKLSFKHSSADVVWFNSVRSENPLFDLSALERGETFDFWVSPQWNDFQGVKRLQLQVKHAQSVVVTSGEQKNA